MTNAERDVDGAVHYRRDGIQRLVGVLPATCRSGAHVLHIAGYKAIETEGLVTVPCNACAEAGSTGAWRLTTGLRPDYAELDDTPYVALLRRAVNRA